MLFLSLYYYEESTYTYVPSPIQCGDLTYDLSTITMWTISWTYI